MTEDIVARLRDRASVDPPIHDLLIEAAETIVRLREDLEDVCAVMDVMNEEIADLQAR